MMSMTTVEYRKLKVVIYDAYMTAVEEKLAFSSKWEDFLVS